MSPRRERHRADHADGRAAGVFTQG